MVVCCETYDGIRILDFSYETPWRLQKSLNSETDACIINSLFKIFVNSACILSELFVFCYLQEVHNTLSRLLIFCVLSMLRLIDHPAVENCFLGRPLKFVEKYNFGVWGIYLNPDFMS